MALQKIFRKQYVEELRSKISPENYAKDIFDYDPSQSVSLYQVPHPESLLEDLIPNPMEDFSSAKEIYEAYKGIPPIVAQLDDFWAYLSHVDLFPYVKNRWPDIQNNQNPVEYIRNHWFISNKHMNGCIAGMWWSIKLTVDDTRSNPYELSEILFKSKSLRESGLLRIREAAIGILEFFMEHKDLMETSFDKKVRTCIRFFNIIGGTKNISILKRDYYKDTLEKNISIFCKESNLFDKTE